MSHPILKSSNLSPKLAVDHRPSLRTRIVIRSEPAKDDFHIDVTSSR